MSSLRRLIASPYLFLVLAVVLWSGNWLMGRGLRAETTPMGLAFWRWTVAALLLLGLYGRQLWDVRDVALPRWKLIGLLSFCGCIGYHSMLYLSLEYTTAINASYFYTASPVTILAVAWLLHRERVSRQQAAGIALSLLGVLGILTRGDPGELLAVRFNPGDLLAIANVPLWALYNVLIRRRPPELRPMVLLTAISAVASVGLLPLWLIELALGYRMQATVHTVGMVLYVGVFASVAALACWNRGVMAVGANRAGPFTHLLPVMVSVLSIVILGEGVAWYHLAGLGLIFAGIYLSSARRQGIQKRY